MTRLERACREAGIDTIAALQRAGDTDWETARDLWEGRPRNVLYPTAQRIAAAVGGIDPLHIIEDCGRADDGAAA